MNTHQSRKSFLYPATALPDIKRKKKIPYEKIPFGNFRGKET